MKMKKLFLLIVFLQVSIAQILVAQDSVAGKGEKGERHEFAIANFHAEGGVTLPQARVVYGTYGHLNAARNNVVLLPSHYMADFHGYEWLIGADRALDPSKLFLVATELFGNGHSSSPSNTPEPLPWPTVSGDDHSRQCGGGSPTSYRRAEGHARAGHCWFLHGRGAGVSMGGELSGLRGPDRGYLRHGEESTRTAWCGWKDRSPHSRRTPHFRTAITLPRPPRVWRRLRRCGRRGCFLRNGGAGNGGASRRPPGTTFEKVLHDFRTRLHPRGRRQRSHPADADLGAPRCWDDAGHDVRWRCGTGAALDQGSGAVHAVGNGSLLPRRGRAI